MNKSKSFEKGQAYASYSGGAANSDSHNSNGNEAIGRASISSVDLENTIVEDIDIDSLSSHPPIAINLHKERNSAISNSGNNISGNNYLTVFMEKENCNNIHSIIDSIKEQLNDTLNELQHFENLLSKKEKENDDGSDSIKYELQPSYKGWLGLIEKIKLNNLQNSNVFLTIPSCLESNIPIQTNENSQHKTSPRDIFQEENEPMLGLSPISTPNASPSTSPVSSSTLSHSKITGNSNNSYRKNSDNIDIQGNNITITNYTQANSLSMLGMVKKKFENITFHDKIKSRNQLSSSTNTAPTNGNSSNSPPSPSTSPSTPRSSKVKSWTSTKPSSSSVFGSYNPSSSTLSSLPPPSLGSRFFTPRQESTLNLNHQLIREKEKVKEKDILNQEKDNIDKENIENKDKQEQEQEQDKIIIQKEEININNNIKRQNSMIYSRLFYDNCESKFDDSTEEEDIQTHLEQWETNVIVMLPCRHHVKVLASSNSTIDSIRQLAWASGKVQGHLLEKEESSFTLRWCNNDLALDIDTPLLHLAKYNLHWNNQKVLNIKLELVESDGLCKERLVDLQFLEINNNGKPSYWKSHIDDVNHFNKKIRELASIAKQPPSIDIARLTTYPPPKTIPEFFVIKIHVKNQTKSLRCTNNHTASSLMTILSEKVKNTLPFNPEEWRFLITGTYQYISPKVPLLSVEYIVDRIKRTGEVDLTMVELSTLGLEKELVINNIHETANRGRSLPHEKSKILEIILGNDKQKKTSSSSSLLSLSTIINRDENQFISSLSIHDNLSIRILHAHEIYASKAEELLNTDRSNINLFIEAGVYFGGELLQGLNINSTMISYQDTVVWNEWMEIPKPISQIPNGSRICFGLNAKYKDTTVNIGWVGFRLFDSKNILNTSAPYSLLLWPGKINPIGTCVDNLQSKDQAIIISFEFKDYNNNNNNNGSNSKTIYFEDNLIKYIIDDKESVPSLSEKEMLKFEAIINQDPLYSLGKEEKQLIWKSRYYCQTIPISLPKLLQSVDWSDYKQVGEMFQLLKNWPILPAVDSLELLDPKFADSVEIREYVVKCLDQLSDYELEIYMLQLVQAIKHDIFHGSVLSLFLLGRVFQNILTLGNPFFWHLRSDIENREVDERFRLLLAAFLRYSPETFREQLKDQITTLRILENLSKKVKDIPFDKRKSYVEQKLLEEENFPKTVLTIPFDPSIRVNNIIPQKCKSMDSAKCPLWVVFKNKDQFAQPFQMIVKSGDDLRQDILTLQLLKLMDHMWKSEDLDLHMTIYRVIATGSGTGLIEVVSNSETAARIQAAAGGMTGAFKQTPIANWLKNHNLTENNYQKAVSKFTLSCAGYCVATYVLGIGDRHNDNIMIDKYGHLFHIDFGHFLGNFKTFAGFQREKAPFVLTPDFVYVIGGKDSPNFNFFVDICCKAYNILRKNAHVFINMFELMLSTGIPELRSESDIVYLRDKFRLDLNDKEASERFKKLIYESINTLTTQINFAIHIMAHRKAIGQDTRSNNSSSNNSNSNNNSVNNSNNSSNNNSRESSIKETIDNTAVKE
ncbi:hypothetical protein CYY_001409 [Polysphondylium violaceum]|uniref:Phosphatidylinositol 3-kinase n=1 Tax=Polysphondylium violaceum TaxID=133409 RepID=A0A8J4Q1W4_9MYCE|nr:hypothetical protein CYY_001409 [Polysphondylium violaceum]